MLDRLKSLIERLRAWMAENERAHRQARTSACCSAPATVYAARKGKDGHE